MCYVSRRDPVLEKAEGACVCGRKTEVEAILAACREYGRKQDSSIKIVAFFTKCDVSPSAMHSTSFDQPGVFEQGTPMSFRWIAEMLLYLLVICVLSCFLNQFLIFSSIQRDVRAYVCSDMGLSIWPVITTCFSFFPRFLFSFRPSCVSVHVSFMYNKQFFLLTIHRCLFRFGKCGIYHYNLFHIFIFLFIFIQSCFVWHFHLDLEPDDVP